MLPHRFIITLFDELAVAVYINMKILIQLDNAFEYPGLFFHRLGRDKELIRWGHGIGCPVLLVILAEGLDQVIMMQNLRLEFRFVELVMGLEIIHRSVEKVDLFSPGNLEVIRHLLRHIILSDGKEALCMKELILPDQHAQELILPILRLFTLAIGVEDQQLKALVLLVVEDQAALVAPVIMERQDHALEAQGLGQGKACSGALCSRRALPEGRRGIKRTAAGPDGQGGLFGHNTCWEGFE